MKEKEMYGKQRERDKQYIRRQKKPEVKKHRYYPESVIESKPKAYYNYNYDESNGKPLLPKKKIKRDRRNLSEEENNDEIEEKEVEDKNESETDNRKI